MGNVQVSVVVVHYNMDRELPRTLKSIIGADEVITVESKLPSPVFAANKGVKQAQYDYVVVLIDGARILSPGVIKWMKVAFRVFKDPFVYTLGMHIGPDHQSRLAYNGWSKEHEKEYLNKNNIGYADGYNLFKVSSLAGSSIEGFWNGASETNCFGCRKKSYLKDGGYDERFTSPGGGFCNLELFKRFRFSMMEPVSLIGEATFHQFHGGISSNSPKPWRIRKEYEREYVDIMGEEFRSLWAEPIYLGSLTGPAKEVFCAQGN